MTSMPRPWHCSPAGGFENGVLASSFAAQSSFLSVLTRIKNSVHGCLPPAGNAKCCLPALESPRGVRHVMLPEADRSQQRRCHGPRQMCGQHSAEEGGFSSL